MRAVYVRRAHFDDDTTAPADISPDPGVALATTLTDVLPLL